MKHLKRLGVAAALVMTAFGVAGSAQATTLTPGNVARTFDSSNALLTVHGGGTIRCSSQITGTLPLAGGVVPISSLTYFNCLGNSTLPASVDVSCSPTLDATTSGVNQAVGVVTLPAGCAISATIPSIACTFTINGPQTVGNGTAGVGGGLLTGGADPIIHLNSTLVRDIRVDGPTTAACATSATHTTSGTLTGSYTGTGTVDVD